MWFYWADVLGSARTGLNFTRTWVGWPKLAKQNRVFDIMCHRAGFRGGGIWAAGSEPQLGSGQGTGWWELLCSFCCLFCIFTLSVLLLLLIALFAVLLNSPYPDPWVFPFFFPFSSPPSGERGDTWPFVASHGQTRTGESVRDEGG